MPVLELDEIPRNAGQYFGTVSVHGHIVFDANSPNAFRVDARFDGDDVPRFQEPLLPTRQPGILVNFQPKPVAGAVHEEVVQTVPRQNLSCSRIDIAAACSGPDRGNGRRLRLQDRLIPRPNAPGSSPHRRPCG